MKKLLGLLFIIIVFTFPSPHQSALAKSKKTAIPKGHAKLIFERESRFLAAATSSRIRIKGNELGSIFSGEKTSAFYKAGTHVIEVDHRYTFRKGSKLKVRLRAGKTYRFYITVRRQNLYPGPSFVPVPDKVHKNGYVSAGYFDIRRLK